MPTESGSTLALQVTAIVQNVYQTMLETVAMPVADTGIDSESPLTAAVHYVGNWKGALILECSEQQASRWAERLLPLAPPISKEDVRDGLGELANVIAGNLKPLLSPGVSLSMPSVIEGADHRLRLPGTHAREEIILADESGPFRITVVTLLERDGRPSALHD